MQGGQEGFEAPSFILFLNLQYRAGPHTAKADITANTTRQHLKQFPDRLVISLYLCVSLCVCLCVRERERQRDPMQYWLVNANSFSCF